MGLEDRLYDMIDEAREIEDDDPRRAIEILRAAEREYPKSITMKNLVFDDIIRVARANEWWQEAAQAADRAAKAKPRYSKDYELEARACRLQGEGKHHEALETRMESTRLHSPLSPMGYRYFANEFAKIGAHDRAWRLYNQAIGEAGKEGSPTHLIRKDMVGLLLKEDKPNHAVEIAIMAFHEAELLIEGDPPQILDTTLRKALRAAGFNMRLKKHRQLPARLIETCRSQGRDVAIELFHAWKEAGEEPERQGPGAVEPEDRQVVQGPKGTIHKSTKIVLLVVAAIILVVLVVCVGSMLL